MSKNIKISFSLANFNLAFVYVVCGGEGRNVKDGRRVEKSMAKRKSK